jgi:hypothetical protein
MPVVVEREEKCRLYFAEPEGYGGPFYSLFTK